MLAMNIADHDTIHALVSFGADVAFKDKNDVTCFHHMSNIGTVCLIN